MSTKNVSLSEKIADLLTTKPNDNDEDEEEIQAKLTENVDEFSDADENQQVSSFRKHNTTLLEDLDERYAGKRSSRKKLGIIDGDDSPQNSDLDTSILQNENASESDSGEDSDDQGGESDDEGSEALDEQEDNFQHIDESKSKGLSKNKGHCVRNQLLIWEGLLEIRIQFQKCLLAANKMPREVTYTNLLASECDFSIKVTETNKTISEALGKLLELQDALVGQFPESKNIYNAKSSLKRKSASVESDEEIPSETDAEESDSEPENQSNPVKKQKLDVKVELNKRHNQYTDFRNSVIQKWNDKTRLATNKSSINNHSVVNQIEHNLSDKSRLIRKTQLKRSQYNIIGDSPLQTEADGTKDEEIQSRVAEEYNSNIFDDDDFYHHLLRELIEVKSADLTDPVQLGRQWIQLQNLRSKMKRKIDTKATKGRKIRYAVHSKLVNFMAPIDDCTWTNEAKNELYSSLFGKK